MLRDCTLRFAPYGFRATWHHLLISSGVPRDLDSDPDSLVRAVDELAEARTVWLAHQAAFRTRRSREKADGHRALRRSDRWHRWDSHNLAYCPDPQVHPGDRLAIVVGRLIDAYTDGDGGPAGCPLCGHRPRRQPCPGCGIVLRGHLALPDAGRTQTTHRWREIWRRTTADLPGEALMLTGAKLAALRLGRRLVAEVLASAPGRRAFVDIVPVLTDADRTAAAEGWTRRDTGRAFRLSLREYDESSLSTDDYDIGEVLVASATADGETALTATLARWSLRPDRFDFPWHTDDPR